MYDAGDVLNASYCSADVATHVLREYGKGSMGAGIRKFASEMFTFGRKKSYNAGVKKGAAIATIICACTTSAIGIGVFVTKKVIDYNRLKKPKQKPIIEEKQW